MRPRAIPWRCGACIPRLSDHTGLLPKHEVGACRAAAGERSRGAMAPASLAFPIAPVCSLSTKWVHAGWLPANETAARRSAPCRFEICTGLLPAGRSTGKITEYFV
uniref:Uncharacterized protein n=1 Tax=Triticum urartu TaxID=4572 RepID=A0A8R7U522_TRIUA